MPDQDPPSRPGANSDPGEWTELPLRWKGPRPWDFSLTSYHGGTKLRASINDPEKHPSLYTVFIGDVVALDLDSWPSAWQRRSLDDAQIIILRRHIRSLRDGLASNSVIALFSVTTALGLGMGLLMLLKLIPRRTFFPLSYSGMDAVVFILLLGAANLLVLFVCLLLRTRSRSE